MEEKLKELPDIYGKRTHKQLTFTGEHKRKVFERMHQKTALKKSYRSKPQFVIGIAACVLLFFNGLLLSYPYFESSKETSSNVENSAGDNDGRIIGLKALQENITTLELPAVVPAGFIQKEAYGFLLNQSNDTSKTIAIIRYENGEEFFQIYQADPTGKPSFKPSGTVRGEGLHSISINGNKGVLVEKNNNGQTEIAFWKDGISFSITGTLTGKKLMDIAESLELVKGGIE
ncbi:DUF4367 domain-containing protein [Pseudalkalibacillus caeni]|uniref:DUF4367 domain-containing protein n=1 Tax=Exobacillus caeni TaxID=2574798 RepID=A0A5R9F437_9BACL|nr:DUF4367 domain-containing protein [Pseudalkalibacillus caeni]TLS37150.1 DUF4367 domain-containing protein [Pseudalkalibacillus caeni]